MLTSRSLARCLLLLSVNAVLLASSAAARQDNAPAFPLPTPAVAARQIFPITGDGGKTNQDTATNTSTNSASATTTSTSTDTSTTSTSTTSTSTTSTSTTSTSTSTTSDTSTSTTASPTSTQPTSTAPTSPPAQSTITTESGGVAVTVTFTPSGSSSSATGSPTQGADNAAGSKTQGISKSTIIGLAVSGGVALIGLISFVIWKFTRKRFTDDDLDNEAIKWPELNAHGEEPSHALPTNRTGGAGFETSSQVNIARPDSRAGSIAPSAAASSVELFGNRSDPYAVPPLPHLNPNMPYRDDPSQVYYDNDPYAASGAAAAAAAPVEAYPMTQIGRTRSPGPQAAYGYDGRVSPGPQQSLSANYGAGPNPAFYNGARTASPAPNAGRMSPGPQNSYGPAPGY
ncbi:hypothetical protein GSI_02097 [Ganoderma sinense ZZ0214-1]|uniref:Transporter n=1 Tax=Ganoderma sinense ZZ0214-1 TaxID=1077348 RepID=A0A2G8SNN3_9APHY|nr:hypothetical protein GSI_02097 [Ganoderma sinense ZZ0214-1]